MPRACRAESPSLRERTVAYPAAGAAQWKENKEWVPPANYGRQAPTGPPSEIVALAPPNTLEDVLEELQRS